MVIFTPKKKVKQVISQKYGNITYESLGENESLGGIISTRNIILRIRSNGQTYEFGNYGRPIYDPEKTKIEILNKSKPISEKEKIKQRKRYIEFSKISGPEVKDYSETLGEWGDNPRTEPRTRKIREIYILCKGCKIPIWICDTLEPVLDWGENKKEGIENWLRNNYQKYLGLPLYKIPPINFKDIDINSFPEIERDIIKQGKLDSCNSFAEQNIVLLQEACKIFSLNPILIDQKKLREVGAYKKGIDIMLEDKEELGDRFGEQNLFRVECPKCGKYIFNIKIEGRKIRGVCNGKVRKQRTKDRTLVEETKYEGCGDVLEENLDYLYKNSIPNGKILTSIYMSNSDVGIFFPDFEFVPENVVTGGLERIVLTTGEFFNSGSPTIIKTAWFTKDRNIENIFSILDILPIELILERFEISPSYRRINIKQTSIEPALLSKLKRFNPPTDTRLIADIMYSLNGKSINLRKLGWNVKDKSEYIIRLLRCLGKVRKNKVILAKPQIEWEEDYKIFMETTYVPDNEIESLRKLMKNPNSPIRTIREIAYLATLTNKTNLNKEKLNYLRKKEVN